MIKFYFAPAPNPAKIALFLEEAGLEYEVIPIDTRKGEQHSPEFLAINPNGKTPALIEDDIVLFDSTAILLHLSHRTGKFWIDSSAPATAEMLSWLMFVATGIGPYSGQATHFNHYAPERIEYAVNRYMFEADRHWKLLDNKLANSRYMIADTYSIVDMSIWGWAQAMPFVLGPDAWDKYPNVKRMVDDITARPAAQRALALATKFKFKEEMDDEARRAMFKHTEVAAASAS